MESETRTGTGARNVMLGHLNQADRMPDLLEALALMDGLATSYGVTLLLKVQRDGRGYVLGAVMGNPDQDQDTLEALRVVAYELELVSRQALTSTWGRPVTYRDNITSRRVALELAR